MRGEDLARVEGDDRDLALVDDREDAPTAMGRPDPEVMKATGPTEGDGATPVDEVVAEPEMTPAPRTGRQRLGVAR